MNKKSLLLFVMFATCFAAFGQSSSSTSSSGESIWDILLNILMSVGFLWMIGHMVYELFIKKNPFTPISIQEMQNQRREFGQSVDMLEDDVQQCANLAQQEFELWTPIPNDPEGTRIITTKKQLDHAESTIAQIKELRPTDPELVEGVNGYIEMLAESRKRVFTGSKLIYVLLALFGILMYNTAGWSGVSFCIISGVIYYFASLTPNFMLYRKELKGNTGNGALSWVFGALASMILGAQTIRTTTTWSDGSKTVEDDNSQHHIAWFISLIVTVLIVCLLVFWAAVNYIRNYVLYR